MSTKNKKGKNNKEVEDNLDNFEEGSLELYTGELVPNSNNTVQPIALMRLGLFVPTLKGTKYSKRNKPNEI
ncbi:TPA: replication initiation protein, partial [Escherichia coli G199]|nr:replication initiation protein [Escherichia coli G199]